MKIRFLQNWNLRAKFMIILVLFILIPLMIFGMLFYGRSQELVSQRTDKEAFQVLTLVKQNVSQLLKEYELQLHDIYEHEEIMKQLSSLHEGKTNVTESKNEEDSVNRFLRNSLRGKDDLDSIYLFTPLNTFFGDFKGSNLFVEQYKEHPSWSDLVSFADGRAVWLPTFKLPPNQYNSKPSYYFTVGMQLKDVFDSLQTLGTLLLNIRISALDNIMNGVQVSPHSVLIISDHQGNIIWHQSPETYGINLSQFAFFDQVDRQAYDHTTQKMNGQVYRVNFIRSESNGWYYFSLVPQSDLNTQTEDLKRFLVATAVAFAALFTLLAGLTSHFVTRPIRRMALAMKNINRGGLEIMPKAQSEDELGMLQAAFYSMRTNINDLFEQVRTISQKEKEAEIRALQAQINPHFVYNSLDTINWLAIENNQNQISKMITSLSDIMRYAIRPGEQWVMLEEELKWVKNYAYLQEMRFEEKFEVIFDVNMEELSLKVPRLLFQPFLENSMIHGMEDIETGGIIRIAIHHGEDNESLIVIIEDNGSGIPEETLQQIQERRSRGIGIYNLDDRLKMEFGWQFGVTIHSKYGEGTTVTIVLPYIR